MIHSNFDENTKSRIVLAIVYFMAGLLVIISVLAFFFLVGLFLRGERDLLILLLPLLPVLSLLYVSKYLFWLLHRVAFSTDGIIVQSIFKQTAFAWDSVEEYGIFAISLFTTSNITPYFLFILSSPIRVRKKCTDLSMCFFLRRSVIPVRYSEDRNRQLEDILNQKTKLYDWNTCHRAYEWNPNRVEHSFPLSPWPKWQRYEEQKRKKQESAGEG